MSITMPIAFNAWSAQLNNFVVEAANFTGVEIGILQSLREVPGFFGFHYSVRSTNFARTNVCSSIARSSGAGSGDDRIFPNGVWALFYDGNNEYRVPLF